MLDLADLSILLLFGAAAAWLWRGHGIRERALALVRRHCEQAGIILLDDNVALQRLRWMADARGQRRLARVYGFEFTVTGEQRHTGSISMFGQHLGKVELAAHPVSKQSLDDGPVVQTLTGHAGSYTPGSASFGDKPRAAENFSSSYAGARPKSSAAAEVIQLHEWRQQHPPAAMTPPADSSLEHPVEPPPTRH